MTGDLFVDDIDAYTQWGINIQSGGYDGLIQYPPLKDIQFNDWPDEDGIDPDLSDPHLNIKSFNVQFGSRNEVGRQSFIEYLANNSYHVFRIPALDYERTLRCMSEPAFRQIEITNFTLQFVDDYPDLFAVENTPIPTGVVQTGYALDNVDLSAYGITVLEGTDDSIEKMPLIKPNLLRSNSASDGALYSPSGVYYQAKDVVLQLNMRADDLQTFTNNYYAFFAELSKPQQRGFRYPKSMRTYPCYYKSSTVSRFDFKDGFWCDFNITISFTSYRVGAINFVLGSEDDNFIVTENNLLIDLNEN